MQEKTNLFCMIHLCTVETALTHSQTGLWNNKSDNRKHKALSNRNIKGTVCKIEQQITWRSLIHLITLELMSSFIYSPNPPNVLYLFCLQWAQVKTRQLNMAASTEETSSWCLESNSKLQINYLYYIFHFRKSEGIKKKSLKFTCYNVLSTSWNMIIKKYQTQPSFK